MTRERDLAVQNTSVNSERPAAKFRNVDVVVSLMLLALAILFGWDSHRIGSSWADDGPQAGYFPFYLSIILGVASLYGVFAAVRDRSLHAFVTREQLGRVMQVFVPTLLFCIVTQFLGLYVASFLLISGFMWRIGGIALWKSALVAFTFTVVMFLTFEIAFNVIMPKGPLEAAFGY